LEFLFVYRVGSHRGPRAVQVHDGSVLEVILRLDRVLWRGCAKGCGFWMILVWTGEADETEPYLNLEKGEHGRINRSETTGRGGMPGYSRIRKLTGWTSAYALSDGPLSHGGGGKN